jgi:hypothetical protein
MDRVSAHGNGPRFRNLSDPIRDFPSCLQSEVSMGWLSHWRVGSHGPCVV